MPNNFAAVKILKRGKTKYEMSHLNFLLLKIEHCKKEFGGGLTNTIMEINKIISYLMNDIGTNFVQEMNENPPKNENRMVNFTIFSRNSVRDAMLALEKISSEMGVEELSEELVEFTEKLCHFEPARQIFEYVDDLDVYLPRPEALETLKETSKNKNTFAKNDIVSNYRALGARNMSKHFNALLELEDVEILREYLPFIQRDVFLRSDLDNENLFSFQLSKQTPDDIGIVVKPNLDEAVIVSKEEVFEKSKNFVDTTLEWNCIKLLVQHPNENLPKALVTKISQNQITMECKKVENNIRTGLVDIVFRPKRQPIRFQYRAIKLLSEDIALQRYLFPKEKQKLISADKTADARNVSFKLINNSIAKNPEQLEVVRTLVLGTNHYAPYIIFGPPGTGKTTTIVECILQIRLQQPNSRVLVAAGSNAACDTIAMRLCEYFELSPILVEQRQDMKTLPMIRIFSKEILHRGVQNLPDELLWRSNITWCNGIYDYPAIRELQKYGIIITTLCTVGRLVCGHLGSEISFTHVFIDEAGASSEPEALVGIMGVKNYAGPESCQVILSGDHKQLGPVLQSDKAQKNGLGISLMERLLAFNCYAVKSNGDYDRTLQMRLRRNYRSHSEIVRLYNHLYYDNDLIAMKEDSVGNAQRQWSILPNPRFPIAFQVVEGEMSHEDTTSLCNELEITFLLAYIQQLLRVDEVKQQDIGVITPYKLQCKRIKNRVLENNWCGIEVGSVENFQGREKLIIIASMVRSDRRLGFVKCPRRLNVLLSRPIALLVILGEPTTLSRCKDIEFIINECKLRGNYITSNELKFKQKKSLSILRSNGGSKLKAKNESIESFVDWPCLGPQSKTNDTADLKTCSTQKKVSILKTKAENTLNDWPTLDAKSMSTGIVESEKSSKFWAAFETNNDGQQRNKSNQFSKQSTVLKSTAKSNSNIIDLKSKTKNESSMSTKACTVSKPRKKFVNLNDALKKENQKIKSKTQNENFMKL